MQKKLFFLMCACMCIVTTLMIYPSTTGEIDGLIDFYKTMSDFNLLQNPEAENQSTDKVVLLVGAISIAEPSGSFDFLYTTDEILKPAEFLAQFEHPTHKVLQFLSSAFSARTKTSLAIDPLDKKVSALVLNINSLLRQFNLYKEVKLQPGDYPEYTPDFLKAKLADDELAFLNRLLLDKILKGIVSPVTITIELIRGEWYGYERVESYTCIIRFSGSTAFRIFNRRKPYESSDFMIPLNSRVLLAATPTEIAVSPFGKKKTWIFTGHLIRQLK